MRMEIFLLKPVETDLLQNASVIPDAKNMSTHRCIISLLAALLLVPLAVIYAADAPETAASDKLERVTGQLPPPADDETSAGWKKFAGNPVMGGKYGTCFDISVLREGDKYRMWLSWRPKAAVALVESKDGIHWSEPPRIVLGPRTETGWEDDINRPVVLKRGDVYHMWYTGQIKPEPRWPFVDRLRHQSRRRRLETHERQAGAHPTAVGKECRDVPVRDLGRAGQALPHVVFRRRAERAECHRLRHQPRRADLDEVRATTRSSPPIRRSDWERHKVAGVPGVKDGDWYVMFYIGFQDEPTAKIGLARSKDGITDWQRHPGKPDHSSGQGQMGPRRLLQAICHLRRPEMAALVQRPPWHLEQIGVALHEGEDLGF